MLIALPGIVVQMDMLQGRMIQELLKRAAGVSMAYVQDQAQAVQIQVRLFKEEPFAFGHVLHRQGNSQLILEGSKLGQ